jgi:hypothetical protein
LFSSREGVLLFSQKPLEQNQPRSNPLLAQPTASLSCESVPRVAQGPSEGFGLNDLKAFPDDGNTIFSLQTRIIFAFEDLDFILTHDA